MIPATLMITGRSTVSGEIKGKYDKEAPSNFSRPLRPVIFWNITRGCNLKCLHCYISAGPDTTGDLPTEKAIEIAHQISEMKIPLVVFSGGEPLYRKDFFEIASSIDSPTKIALSSNGTLISEKIADKLAETNFSYIGISIDSVHPEVHDVFRGVKGSFEKAVNGIRNSINVGLSVGIRTTLTKGNIEEVGLMLEFAHRMGVHRISLYLLDIAGRATQISDLLPTKEQIRRMVDSLIESIPNYDFEVLLVRMNFAGIYLADKLALSREDFLKYLRLIRSQGDCGRKTISIFPDGEVKPCQFLSGVTVGDLKRERLSSIISYENTKLRPFFHASDMLRGPKCSTCPFKDICGGGSRMRALNFGDFWGDDPTCFIDAERIADKWQF